MMKLKIVSWIFFFALSFVNCTRYELASPKQWQISWGNFNKNAESFNIQNLISKTIITFNSFKNTQLKATNIAYTQNGFSYLRYQQKQCKNPSIQNCDFVYLIGKQSEGFIKINNPKNKQVRFLIDQANNQDTITIISSGGLKKANFKQIDKVCQPYKKSYKCSFNSNEIFIVIVEKQFYSFLKDDQQVFISFVSQQQVTKAINSQLHQLLSKYYIDVSKSQITQAMLTITLDSICVQNGQYEGIRYFGMCKQTLRKYQMELHYSLLIVQVLMQYNYKLGAWLFQNYLNYIQEEMFYSNYNQVEWIPIPQHIQVTSSYMKTMKILQSKYPEQKSKNKVRIKKVEKVLNGFINQNLLSQVNHLSEEINYRQTNKLHPTLLKMLTLGWKGTDPKKMGLSIYEESFTNDFYYHQKSETVSNNVGKIMWLNKVLNQYIALFKNYGDQFQKQSLQQAISLVNVVHGYSLDDPHAKNGNFYSIIKSQSMRVYCKEFGYESFLPYIYQATQIFPQSTLRNLTTSFGLASMSPLSQKANSKFNFRGNVHLYFNYKILFKSLFLSMAQKQNQNYYVPIRQMTKKYQQKVVLTYSDWSKTRNGTNFYSQWHSNGVGLKSQGYLAILNAVFLTNIKQFDIKMEGEKQRQV